MKLLIIIMMLLGSFALLAADFCVATPYSGTKSLQNDYHINCGQESARFLEKSSMKKSVARDNLFAEMMADGMSHVGSFPRRGQFLFSTRDIRANSICIAYPGSARTEYNYKDAFRIDCNDSALTILYATPVTSKGIWSTRYLPNETGKRVLNQYMTKKNYSLLSTLEISESWLGYFTYIFERN